MNLLLRLVILTLVVIVTACSGNQTNHDGHGAENDQQKQHEQHEASNNQHKQHEQHEAGAPSDTQTEAVWKTVNENLQSKRVEEITIEVKDRSGKQIEDFAINHEQKMHLIVVSKDLSFFDHLHPAFQGNGLFKVTEQFPAGGEYKLIADYIPQGGQQETKHTWVTVSGETAPGKPLEADKSFTKVVEGTEITLDQQNLRANTDVTLTFSFKDAATKKPVTDLQPYLGAVGHVVIISADAEKYIHNHPLEEKSTGPDAKFETSFPASGMYKIWGQFQRNGKVFVVPFVVQVQ